MRALLIALSLAAGDPSNQVHDYIQVVAPHVKEPRARNLARLIYRMARKYELDPITLATIVRQESNFRSDAKNCYVVYRHGTCVHTCDLGLAQINSVWVEKWNLNPCLLTHDDGYNLQVAARILKNLKNRYGMTEPLTWFSRYNSSVDKYRQDYQARLNTFLVQRTP